MIKIYSKINPELLLHLIFRINEAKEERLDLTEPKEYLQCAVMLLNKKKFNAHKHIERLQINERYVTQESFVIIQGRVKCIFYDTSKTIIAEHIIGPGDISITFHGGHNYEILEDNTIIYEFKSGPYLGPVNDRIRI